MALLKITFTLSNGADTGFIKIDRAGVRLVNGRGEKEVDDTLERHRVTLFFEGRKGGTLEYEIKQDTTSLAKGKIVISEGFTEGGGSGWFKLKAAA
jgi:hypothetical protein